MADIEQLLNDGVIPVINAGQELQQDGNPIGPQMDGMQAQINDGFVRISDIEAALADGINLPSLPAASASNNSIFFNTDIDRVCWKSTGGLILKFNMELV